MRSRVEFALALLLQLLGAGGALLLATRAWQTVVTPRERPFADDLLGLSGRTIDAAPTALALVALAGVVAVLATRATVRRVVGVVVTLAGAGLVWRSVAALSAVSASSARAIVRDRHPRVSLSSALVPQVTTHPVWGVLSIVCGVLVLVAGLLVAARGGRWSEMSAKYDAPDGRAAGDPEQQRQRADASLWTALDRGEDPTRSE